jgi:hypothetical protein
MTFAVKTGQRPEAMTSAIRRQIQALDPNQPIDNVSAL